MAFPATILDLQASLYLGGAWTTITSDVYNREDPSPAVTITRGRPDETTQAPPTRVGFKLNNRSGNYTSRNPLGTHYGLLGRNTPVRFSVPGAGVVLRMEDDQASSASTPDSVALSVTGSVDIRVDVQLSGWETGVLAAKWDPTAGSANHSWLLFLNNDGTVTLAWSTTGSDLVEATSTAPMPLGRSMVRATMNATNGTVQFFTAATMAGSQTGLGATVTGAGATSIHDSTAHVTVGNYDTAFVSTAGINGSVFEMQYYNGIAGTKVADPVFTAQTAGAATFADAQSNTWTMNGSAELSSRSYRAHAEMASLPVQWDPSGKDVWTAVSGAGILRRLGQNNTPVLSTMQRGILAQSGTLAPVAYWPMEDLQGATQAGSATGGPPMIATGAVSFAADSSFLASNAIPQMNHGTLAGPVPAYTSHGSVVVRFLMNVEDTPGDGARIVRVHTTGTCHDLSLYYGTGGTLGMAAFDSTGTSVFDSGEIAFAVNNEPVWVSMELRPGGGSTVDWSFVTLQPGASSGLAESGTFTGTIGNVTAVAAAPTSALADVAIGHISVQSDWQSLFALFQPLNAWQGEAAGNRFIRLCAENSIPSRVYGYPATTAAMGAQSPETLISLLQECEKADRGMIYEPRQCLGLGYRTLVALLNQAAGVTLNYAAAQIGDGSTPLVPTDDDQYSLNDFTGTRGSGSVSGSSYQFVLNDGSPMSISLPTASPPGIGDYDGSDTLNLAKDSQLADTVGWIVHVGTVNEGRFPAIPLHLSRTELASLMQALQAIDVGDYIAISNPPAWLPPDLIRQLAFGTTEGLGGKIFTMAFNAVPESPYETGVYDSGDAYDTAGSTVATGFNTTATSLSIATTDPALWTTTSGDFPFDIAVGGERITVTSITGTSSPQTFTVTRSVNTIVKSHLAGEDVRLWNTPIYAIA